jgi:predicted transcriptional regulator
MFNGIQLDDNTSFRVWAESILPWLNESMHYVAEGISGDIPQLLERQEKYTGIAGRLVELYAESDAFYQTALAEAIEKYSKTLSPSLVARTAAKDCRNELRVFEAIHRLNSTISDQLMSIASRLRFEKTINFGNQNNTCNKLKDMPFMKD